MYVYVELDQENRVAVSTLPPEGYCGPFEVPDTFAEEQHLYKLVDGKLVYDIEYADKLAAREKEIEEENAKRAAAEATYQRLLARMMAQASPEDAEALKPIMGNEQ